MTIAGRIVRAVSKTMICIGTPTICELIDPTGACLGAATAKLVNTVQTTMATKDIRRRKVNTRHSPKLAQRSQVAQSAKSEEWLGALRLTRQGNPVRRREPNADIERHPRTAFRASPFALRAAELRGEIS